MWRIKLILATFLLILANTPMSLAQASLLQRVDWPRPSSVGDLWIDVSLGPPLTEWFNRVARPEDIARVDNVRQIDLLDEITVGRRLVVFRSVAEAEHFVPEIADRIDMIGYNLEHGVGYPLDEQADPVSSVKRMHDLAQQYGLRLAFGPDHQLAMSDGVAVAPYVDIFVLQIQRVQTERATVLDFVRPMIEQLRRANPKLDVSVQVRTEGDVAAIVDLIDSIKDDLDGVSILTSPETVKTAEALVTELRTRKSALRGPVTKQATLAAKVETAPAPPWTQAVSPSWPLVMAGALAAGAIGGGLVAVLICSYRKGADGK